MVLKWEENVCALLYNTLSLFLRCNCSVLLNGKKITYIIHGGFLSVCSVIKHVMVFTKCLGRVQIDFAKEEKGAGTIDSKLRERSGLRCSQVLFWFFFVYLLYKQNFTHYRASKM